MKKFENIFKIVSIIFIIGCCLFYGGRLIYYYNKLKPEKVNGEVIKYAAQTIKENSGIVYENSGLYMAGTDFIFKGDVLDNYVSYSQKLWRIVKINQDGTIKLALNEDATVDNYSLTNTKYEESVVYDYLSNDFFATLVDTDKILSEMIVCSDMVNDLSNIGCNQKLEKQKIGLIDVNDFSSSIINEKTYINTENAIWTINPSDENQMWVAYNNKMTMVSINERYGIRPVITLNSNVKIKSGDGTISDPYMLEV